MKRSGLYKTIQLILLILLSGAGIYALFSNPEAFHMASEDGIFRLLCTILWAVLAVSFVFIFIDFSYLLSMKRDYRQMNYAANYDPISGIANRFSCDVIIEKYLDKPLPSEVGCVMLDLANIREINESFGHMRGNAVIRDFSSIIQLSSSSLCFAGNNGGSKFLAIFEEGSEHAIQTFLNDIEDRVKEYNAKEDATPIVYRSGIAFHEDPSLNITSITQLIALSNRRLTETERKGGSDGKA